MPLLEVRGLVKSYGRRRVVDGVSFEVAAGEVVGLLGPNGAGKTTSFRMTTGQVTPLEGCVLFDDKDVTHLPMYKRARLGMGYLSQEQSIFRKLTVEQNLLAILEMMPAARTLGRALTRKERWERTESALEKFGLLKIRKSIAGRCSGGEKRRLEIARCLVCEPLLILLDEPFTGIDPITIADIREIIIDLRNSGIGILLTDHNVREALRITTRSYLIKDGKVRTHGTPMQIINDPVAISEYLGAGFNDNNFEGTHPPPPAQPKREAAAAAPIPITRHDAAHAPEPATKPPHLQNALEEEKVARLIEALKLPEHGQAAASLVQRGPSIAPLLIMALERRDVEIRRQVLQVLQTILKRSVAFDPYAPEALRRQQLAALRQQTAAVGG